MKVFGYVQRQCNDNGLVELSEVTFQAPPTALRQLAQFLLQSADELEHDGAAFGHRHIQDEVSGWSDETPERPDVIVCA